MRITMDRRARAANWLTEKISGSDWVHVAVGDGELVYSAGIYERLYYSFDQYLRLPNIDTIVQLEPLRCWEIDGFGNSGSSKVPLIPIWKSLLKAGTSGFYETGDCVCMAKQVLKAAGYDPPRWAWSPRLLMEWITTDAPTADITRRSHWVPRQRRRTGDVDGQSF